MVLGLIPCSSAIWETGKFSSLILLRIYSLISGEILNDFFICSYCRNTWRKCQRFGVPANMDLKCQFDLFTTDENVIGKMLKRAKEEGTTVKDYRLVPA